MNTTSDALRYATRPAAPKNRDEFIALLDYALLIGKALNRQLDEAFDVAVQSVATRDCLDA